MNKKQKEYKVRLIQDGIIVAQLKCNNLEDFEKCVDVEGGRIEGSVYTRQLKAEAVKWVKGLKDYSTNYETTDEPEIIGWIKHFFNLTEEDLK
jgi:hypothetical protein